jgi:hypothetical protein
MSFRLSSKLNVIVLILLLSIGFAAVATNLIINGGPRISTNPDDFDVFFAHAYAYNGGDAAISNDKKAITWSSNTLTYLGQKAYLDFTVYNSSANYDANVTISLDIQDVINNVDYSDYYTIKTTTFSLTEPTLVRAKEAVQGTIEVELVKVSTEDVSLTFTMSMIGSSISRDASVGPAHEPCSIVKGSGYQIGDEIECAGDNFYLLSNDNGTITMLSKYNLMYGEIYGEVVVDEARFTELINTYGRYYNDRVEKQLVEEPEFAAYKAYDDEFYGKLSILSVDGDKKYFKVEKSMKDYESNAHPFVVRQDSRAIGAHGDELGAPAYPEVGIKYDTFPSGGDENTYDVYFTNDDYYYDYVLEDYEEFLQDNNVFPNGLYMLGLDDIKTLIYRLTNRQIPLRSWFENQRVALLFDNEYTYRSIIVLGDLKEYVPAGYEWIYSTTYWTKTNANTAGLNYYENNDDINMYEHGYFVDTLGLICSKFGCESAVGAGIRPVIRMDDMFLDYSTATSNGIDS